MADRVADVQTMTMRNDLREIQRVEQMICDFITQRHLPLPLARDFVLAADELLTNIISYGYDDAREHLIQLQLQQNQDAVVLRIEDDARAYNPLLAPMPDETANVSDRPIGGLGIYIVRQLVDDLEYQHENGKNILIVTKRFLLLKGS